jgi:sugar O-acyltransferase (sialic acid O-acetyltransferase NeuD family)
MSDLVLFGGGGHASACIDVLLAEGEWAIRGIIEQDGHQGVSSLGYPVLGTDSDSESLVDGATPVFIAVGQLPSPAVRKALYDRLHKSGAIFPVVQSPRAYVSPMATVGSGSIIMHGAVVNTRAQVGQQCIINSQALIEHDAILGEFCHVSTGALINGGASIGDGCFVGSGAIVREGVHIGNDVVVGAGVRVMKDLPSGTVVKAGS